MNAFLHEIVQRTHPALVHFPITLFPVSLFFLLLYWWRQDGTWLESSYACYMIAVVFIIPVAITGIMDYVRLKPHDDKAHGALMWHVYNGVLITLISLVSGIYFWQRSPIENEFQLPGYTLCTVVLSALVLIQGAIAALMIYQHKLGVEGETR